ncbi:MAG TPA: ornithine carbamoyltransferase [Alphaproteobacteria bacterium]|jgi:ornithine carbamoyltransferase|nr:ornithine carbamoyltransferase [Alphaproteobacteria bacterium]
MPDPKHFLDLDRLDSATLRDILNRAVELKMGAKQGGGAKPLSGKTLAMIFEKPSTRTRVSFEVGMHQLGGDTVILTHTETQLGRGETIADTARVLSRYVDAIMIRTDSAKKLFELVSYATVPVINGLTDTTHPCQLMADIMTFEEKRGPITGKTVAWVGDGNNVAASWIQAAARFDFELRVAGPKRFWPDKKVLDWARAEGGKVTVTEDAAAAVKGAHCVVTDTWVSMGSKNAEDRRKRLRPYRVDDKLMARADPSAVFMHCLPAHRGEEVSGSVIDGPQSVVWDEAENRLHVQKGILIWCLT